MNEWSRDLLRARGIRSATALMLLAACARPRYPITTAPATAPSPATRTTKPIRHDVPAGGSTAVPLATAAVLGSSMEADVEYLNSRRLMLPVAGIRPDQLSDSFDTPRDGSRRHHAIDILAPRGTPVLAADDGRVLRVSWNNAGGNTVYTTDTEGRIVYYYAHLDRYHDSIVAGMPISKGDTIGYVGTTGNAPRDIPHLHFQIMRMAHDGKYWNGEPIDPFPILRGEGERP